MPKPDVSRAGSMGMGLSARHARPRGLLHPSVDAQPLGQPSQHRIEIMTSALAATAVVGRHRLLAIETDPGDRIGRHVGYFCGAGDVRRAAAGRPVGSEIGCELTVSLRRGAAFALAEDRSMTSACERHRSIGRDFCIIDRAEAEARTHRDCDRRRCARADRRGRGWRNSCAPSAVNMIDAIAVLSSALISWLLANFPASSTQGSSDRLFPDRGSEA